MAGTIAIYTKTWHSSGTGLFAQELVQALCGLDQTVVFIAPKAENARFEKRSASLFRIRTPREASGGSRVKRIATSASRVLGSAMGILRARVKTRTFIVTIPDPLIFSLPMLCVLKITGAQIIYVVHDPVPHSWRLPRWARKIEQWSYTLAYRLSSALVVLSEPGAQALRHIYPCWSNRIYVIEHGQFRMAHPVAPATGSGNILLFGTLRRNKGISQAIEGVILARATGAEVVLTIAGAPDPTEPDYWAGCEKLATRYPDAIRMDIGYVSDDRLHDHMNESDAFLLPYRDFLSQSGVAILALSNARPVIASRSGGLAFFMEDGAPVSVVEEPIDADEIAAALRRFYAMPIAHWNDLAKTYQDHIAQRLSWPAIGQKYLDLMQWITH